MSDMRCSDDVRACIAGTGCVVNGVQLCLREHGRLIVRNAAIEDSAKVVEEYKRTLPKGWGVSADGIAQAIRATRVIKPENAASGVIDQTTATHEELIEQLRSWEKAYPEDIFGPVTEQERKEHANLITRNSAAMGRHCGKFMSQAADVIERSVTPPWKCAARKGNTGANDPQDCDWPVCGCDPYADKVIAALEECGYLTPLPSSTDLGGGQDSQIGAEAK